MAVAQSFTIVVDVKDTGVLRMLRNGDRKTQYAIVNAMNKTTKQIQKAERKRVSEKFQLRQRDFTLREAAVVRQQGGGGGFASVKKDRYETRIAVGNKKRHLLAGFETGAARPPATKGAKSAAVPKRGGPARPQWASEVPDAFEFKALLLRKQGQKRKRRRDVSLARSVTSKGTVQWKGAHRTFMLLSTRKLPHGGVFQRVGKGRDDIRTVYSFKQNQKLDDRLQFIKTALREAGDFRKYLRQGIIDSFKHNFVRTFSPLG